MSYVNKKLMKELGGPKPNLTKEEEKRMGDLFLCAAMPTIMYRVIAYNEGKKITGEIEGDEVRHSLNGDLECLVKVEGTHDYEELKDWEKELGALLAKFFDEERFYDQLFDLCVHLEFLKYIDEEVFIKQSKFVVRTYRKETGLCPIEEEEDLDLSLNSDLGQYYRNNEERFRKHFCKDLTPPKTKKEKRREKMNKREKELKMIGDFIIWQYVLYDSIGRPFRDENEIETDEILFDMIYKIGELILKRLKENKRGIGREEKSFPKGITGIDSAYLLIDNNDKKEEGLKIKERLVTLLLEDKIVTRDKNKMFKQLQQMIHDTLKDEKNQKKGKELLGPILRSVHNIRITNDDLKSARLELEDKERQEDNLQFELAHIQRDIVILKSFILNRENEKIKSEERIKETIKNEGEEDGKETATIKKD